MCVCVTRLGFRRNGPEFAYHLIGGDILTGGFFTLFGQFGFYFRVCTNLTCNKEINDIWLNRWDCAENFPHKSAMRWLFFKLTLDLFTF